MARFTKRNGIADDSLIEAIKRAERGIIDADLGGGLIKQRVARSGQGRSGGYRMIVAYQLADQAVFLYGFAKNERDTIGPHELLDLREIAKAWLQASPDQINEAIETGALHEVHYENQ